MFLSSQGSYQFGYHMSEQIIMWVTKNEQLGIQWLIKNINRYLKEKMMFLHHPILSNGLIVVTL